MEGGKPDKKDEECENEHHERVFHKKNIVINPLRIYITATIGTVFANAMSIIF